MSFSVRNRAAMFEKPGRVDTGPEVEKAPVLKAPASPASPAKSATSYVSSISYKSQNSSPIGSGPYKSYRNNPRRGEGSPRSRARSSTPNRSSAARQTLSSPQKPTVQQRSASPSPRGSTVSTRVSSPRQPTMQQRSASPSPRGSTVSTRVSSPPPKMQQRSASPSPRGSTVSTRVSSPQPKLQQRSASPSPRGSTVSTRVSSPQPKMQQRSASPSPRGSTVSTRVSSPRQPKMQQRSPSPSPRGSTAPTRVSSPRKPQRAAPPSPAGSAASSRVPSPRKPLSPRKRQQPKPTGKIISPFLSTDDVSSKPAVLPLKSPTKPRGWATDNLKSSGLVSKSPFRNASSSHSRDTAESRETSWSKKIVKTEKRDIAEKRDDSLLKTSLDAASVVMEEEKSQAGSSNASSRSSLSAKELGDVAKRALDIANKKTQTSKPIQSSNPTPSQAPKTAATPSFLNNSSSQRSTSPYRGRNTTTPSSAKKEDNNRSSSSRASWGSNLKPSSPAKVSSPRNTSAPNAPWLSSKASSPSKGSKATSASPQASPTKVSSVRNASVPNAPWLSKNTSPSKGSKVTSASPQATPTKVSSPRNTSAPNAPWLSSKASSPSKGSKVTTVQSTSPRFTPPSSPKKYAQPFSPLQASAPGPKADVKSSSPAKSAPQGTASGRAKSRAAAVAAARKNRSVAKSSDSAEARRAILASTTQKKEKKGEKPKHSANSEDVEVAARLGMRASRVLAMKTSHGKSDHSRDEIGSSVSVESGSRSRRVDHPAFAARGHTKNNNEKDKEKPFSSELVSSFLRFGAARADELNQQQQPKVDSFGFPEQEESMHSTNGTGFTPRNEDNIYLNNFSMMSSMHDQMTPSNTGMRTTRSNHSMAQSMISTTAQSMISTTPSGHAATGKITNSPPGFILKDGGEKHIVGTSESANANDAFIDQFFSDHDADAPSPKDSTTGTDLTEPLAMEALNLLEDDQGEEREGVNETSSSKRSANTSIRTGLSSIQNDLQDNGSKSMRSGLSGIFPENSQHQSTHQAKQLPDTIREEEERDLLSAVASQAGTQARDGERDTLFDGTSFKSKAQKDGQNDDTLFEGVSHASSTKSGGWWKGKKVKTSLKNALSKKSPRNIEPVEDDIFGDLEEDNNQEKKKKSSRTKIQRQTKKVTPKNLKVETHDRSGTKLELEENTDVESEITTSILGDGKKQIVDRLLSAKNEVKSAHSSTNGRTTSEKSVADNSRHNRTSIFLNLGCGLGEMLDGTFCNYSTTHTPTSKKGDEKSESQTDTLNLSVKEDQIWKEWEKRDESESNDSNTRSEGKSSENGISQTDRNEMAIRSAPPREEGDATSQPLREGTSQNVSADGQLVDSDEAPAEARETTKRDDTRHSRYSALSASTPMTLSNNQRSLVEKFSKHLSNDGVEVLKLNTKKQWQLRFFTISKEQVALTAHEALKPTGDVAQCPKALLWVKKFSPKTTYGLANIDKYGHGGMMLASLVNIHVDSRVEQQYPIPKKMQEKFKKSVTVTLEYNFDGSVKAVEFLCRDNDQAQFLCTCIRVSRDLLKREETLRQRLKEI